MSPLTEREKAVVREAIAARHESGEHPVAEATIGKGARFTWPVVVALLSIAAIGGVAVAQSQDNKTKTEENSKSIQELRVQAAKTEATLAAMKDLLVEIKADVKDLKNAKK